MHHLRNLTLTNQTNIMMILHKELTNERREGEVGYIVFAWDQNMMEFSRKDSTPILGQAV